MLREPPYATEFEEDYEPIDLYEDFDTTELDNTSLLPSPPLCPVSNVRKSEPKDVVPPSVEGANL